MTGARLRYLGWSLSSGHFGLLSARSAVTLTIVDPRSAVSGQR